MSRHQGINIQDAIAILAARPKHDVEDQVKHDKTMCDTLKTMGQQIDLFPPQQDVKLEATAEAMQGISNEIKQTAISQEEQLRKGLEGLNIEEQLASLYEVQRARVSTYQSFDRSLEQILKTGNLSEYPVACSNATASFAILSNTVNIIKEILEKNFGRNDLRRLIEQLQQREKEKLNLTAELQLERIREKNSSHSGDDHIGKFLNQGIIDLHNKLSSCIDEINEILDELKYATVEETVESR